ncbi:MAG: hypothetical protein AAF570_09895 [Bacteroidota bacterium]
MKRFLGLLILGTVLAVTGCESAPEHPEEAEVKGKIAGSYCSDDFKYRLEIQNDGSYTARRNKKSGLSTSLINEKCEGSYTLKYDEEGQKWTIEIGKSEKNSNPFVSCKGSSQVIWENGKGYVSDTGILLEPFDQTTVTKANCGTD